MSVENVFDSLTQYCVNSSGKVNEWIGNKATYQWTRGKTAVDGTVNGVVRKLAGTNHLGENIWVVAGSIKIAKEGNILRFTGLDKKTQKLLESLSKIRDKALEAIEVE